MRKAQIRNLKPGDAFIFPELPEPTDTNLFLFLNLKEDCCEAVCFNLMTHKIEDFEETERVYKISEFLTIYRHPVSKQKVIG